MCLLLPDYAILACEVRSSTSSRTRWLTDTHGSLQHWLRVSDKPAIAGCKATRLLALQGLCLSFDLALWSPGIPYHFTSVKSTIRTSALINQPGWSSTVLNVRSSGFSIRGGRIEPMLQDRIPDSLGFPRR